MDSDELHEFYKFWRNPKNQHTLEQIAAEKLRLPFQSLVIAGVPHPNKFIPKPAMVKVDGRLQSLFEIENKKLDHISKCMWVEATRHRGADNVHRSDIPLTHIPPMTRGTSVIAGITTVGLCAYLES